MLVTSVDRIQSQIQRHEGPGCHHHTVLQMHVFRVAGGCFRCIHGPHHDQWVRPGAHTIPLAL